MDDKKSRWHSHAYIERSPSSRTSKPIQKWEAGLGREPGLELSLTPWCAQYLWPADAYFPSCPNNFGPDPIEYYYQNLKGGAVLACSDRDDLCPELTVHEAVILKPKSSILVMCERADCKWSIVGIELNERNHFIHFIIGLSSDKEEAYKMFHSKNETTNFWSAAHDPCATDEGHKEAKTINEGKTLSESVYVSGSRVSHHKFGDGTVINVDGHKLDIKFNQVGIKRIMDNFVRLASSD